MSACGSPASGTQLQGGPTPAITAMIVTNNEMWKAQGAQESAQRFGSSILPPRGIRENP
jgi:hypothetical protein